MPIPVELMPLRMISLPGIDPWISFVHFLKYLGTKRVVANNELLGGKPAAVDVELKEDLGTLGLPVGEADAMEWRLSERGSRYPRSPCRGGHCGGADVQRMEISIPSISLLGGRYSGVDTD
jgi:hypothetical protein